MTVSGAAGALAFLTTCLALTGCSGTAPAVIIAPVNTTSQKILAEIIRQRLGTLGIRADCGRTYDSVALAHQALLAHEVDISIEYDGAAWMAILHHELPARDQAAQLGDQVRSEYAGLQLKWFPRLGFGDPFVMVISSSGPAGAIRTLSDAERQPPWTLATIPEFQTRADGFDTLMQAYPSLRWTRPADTMNLSALYRALAAGPDNMISGHASDPQTTNPDLCVLADDKHRLPPENASVVARFDSLADHPSMESALSGLSGRISLEQLRAMDTQLEQGGRTASDVAAEFLRSR